MNGNRVNGEEITSSVIQVGVYGGLDQGSKGRVVKKWSDLGCILHFLIA